MAKTFQLTVLAADRQFYNGECEQLVFPGADGSRGVLAGHEAMICCLVEGEIRYKADGEWHRAVVSEGFVEIMPAYVKVFADSIERPEEIDILRAKAARERAQERLRQRLSTKQYLHTQAALKRAMARLKGSNNGRREL